MGMLLVLGFFGVLLVSTLIAALLEYFFSRSWTSPGPTRIETQPYLVRDPQCGRMVPRREARATSTKGQTLFFCSRFCQLRHARRHVHRPRDHHTHRRPTMHVLQHRRHH
jgi:hypothetical protein